MRIEPPPSLPCAIGTIPAATAAAEPPEEPPGVRVEVPRVARRPVWRGSVVGRMPNSGMFVVPTHDEPRLAQPPHEVRAVVRPVARQEPRAEFMRSPATGTLP